MLNRPAMARIAPKAAFDVPSFRNAAVCEFTQYAQPLVAETTKAIVSRVAESNGEIRPTASGCVRLVSAVQTATNWTGLIASTRHKFVTKSIPLVFLMSAKISATLPV